MFYVFNGLLHMIIKLEQEKRLGQKKFQCNRTELYMKLNMKISVKFGFSNVRFGIAEWT